MSPRATHFSIDDLFNVSAISQEAPALVASKSFDPESRALSIRLRPPVLDDAVISALNTLLGTVAEKPSRYLLDFGRVEHVRSSGPSLIVPFWGHGGHGVRVTITHCSQAVREQLVGAGFQHLFVIN